MPRKGPEVEIVDDVTFGEEEESDDPEYGLEEWSETGDGDDEDDDVVMEASDDFFSSL